MQRIGRLLILGFSVLISSCKTAEKVVPIVSSTTNLPVQAALVSVQPTGATTAEAVVKLTAAIAEADWQLTAVGPDAKTPITIQPTNTQNLDVFDLRMLRLTGLTAGQPYTLQLRFRYNQKDTLTQTRTYTHTTYNPWKRLAHLSFNDGLFTGSIISHERDFDRSGEMLRITRYARKAFQAVPYTWQTLHYSRPLNGWFAENPLGISLRRGLIEYVLYWQNTDRCSFYGLGYQVDDANPNKYFYLHDMNAVITGYTNKVLPPYEGEDGEVAYFTTTEWAFFLTQNGSPAMRGIHAQFRQEERAPLPEKPGVLATFSLGETGYVINQVPGRQPHLFAYDSQTDTWTRKADFPGAIRSRGSGFSVKGNGYFGLGVSPDQRGLRDIWQYEPATDQWRYLTDYPGEGHRYLLVWSGPNRAYLGWGYENQTIVGAEGTRIVGCTDFWEFTP